VGGPERKVRVSGCGWNSAKVDGDVDVAGPLEDLVGATAILGLEALDGRSLVDARLAHEEPSDIRVRLLGVGDRASEDALHEVRAAPLREVERGDGGVDGLAADEVRDQTRLAGAMRAKRWQAR
jgi:hypothetical protein